MKRSGIGSIVSSLRTIRWRMVANFICIAAYVATGAPALAQNCGMELLGSEGEVTTRAQDNFAKLCELVMSLQHENQRLTQLLEGSGLQGRIEFFQEQTDRARRATIKAGEEAERAGSISDDLKAKLNEAQGEAGRATAIIEDWNSRLAQSTELLGVLKEATNLEQFIATDQFKRQIAELVAPTPRYAVVAFDDPKGCPDGWTEFKDVAGRLILGQGDDSGLSPREYREVGGEEKHTLTVEEMPVHDHLIGRTDRDGDGVYVKWNAMGSPVTKGHVQGLTPAGNSRPHNNMPPYMALYFCKKE